MTPVPKPKTTAEINYNSVHSSARSVIERCNGVLKGRFRCLSKYRTLKYKPTIASKITNACVVLHNMCQDERTHMLRYPDFETDGMHAPHGIIHENHSQRQKKNAEMIRDKLINSSFTTVLPRRNRGKDATCPVELTSRKRAC